MAGLTKKAGGLFQVQDVSKSYGANRVLRGLNVEFAAGEIVLLLGPNGSGKSTLLRICAGLSRTDSGRISTNAAGVERTHTTGYAGHLSHLYGHLSVQENLELAAACMHVPCDAAPELHYWRLDQYAKQPICELSKGQQARAALCRSFLADPQLLFLDEPTSALDDGSVALLIDRIKATIAKKPGAAFALIATHDIHRLFHAADRIVVLLDGIIKADSSMLINNGQLKDRTLAMERVLTFYRDSNR
jgi:ABC-type multidrug transport system ATPase subunit